MSEEVQKLVARPLFKSLIQLANATKKKVQAAAGELGERIKNAAENGNLDPWAFKIVAGLDRQEELKRKGRIANLRAYLDLAEEELWGDGHVGDLAKMGEKEDAEAAKAKADKAAAKKNTKALSDGIKPLSPEAEAEKIARQKAEDDEAFKSDVAAQKARADGSPKVVGFPGAPVNDGKALN